MVVDWSQVIAAVMSVGFAGFAGLQVVRLPSVWRGGKVRSLPWPNMRGPEVNHRSFPVFVGFAVSLSFGVVLVFVSAVFDARVLGVIGTIWAVGGVAVFLPLWVLINAINRPRILVPPAARDEPGWLGQWRARRTGQAASLPDAVHVVEILDVRPAVQEERPYEPYFVAVCAAGDCGWTSDPIGRDEAHPDPERSVREQASRHSTTITGPRRPLG